MTSTRPAPDAPLPPLMLSEHARTVAKRTRDDDSDTAAKHRKMLYEEIAGRHVYRGAAGDDALERCMEGGHFSWYEDTALDYAMPDGPGNDVPAYVIQTTPISLYLGGAMLDHGAQWKEFYDTFTVDTNKQPAYWADMVKLVDDWREAIAIDQTRKGSASDPLPHTKDGFMRTLLWLQPTPDVGLLLEQPGPCPVWDSEHRESKALLRRWKIMVQAAVAAAPWHVDGPSTSEFTATGADLRAGVDKITEYVDDEEKLVFSRTATAGSTDARHRFETWYREHRRRQIAALRR